MLFFAFIQIQISSQFDALTTSLSFVGQILISYKFINNWFFWFLADVLYVYLYFSKSLLFMLPLASFYALLAIIGFLRWSQQG